MSNTGFPHVPEPQIRLGISTCLLGERVRYDGGHKLDHFLVDTLGQFVQWVPVCPEVEMGLPIPREAVRLVGHPDHPRLVAPKPGVDHTASMLAWAQGRLDELEAIGLHGFVFKKGGPQLLHTLVVRQPPRAEQGCRWGNSRVWRFVGILVSYVLDQYSGSAPGPQTQRRSGKPFPASFVGGPCMPACLDVPELRRAAQAALKSHKEEST